MPTIDKCKECGREGGYGKSVDKKICARCERKGDTEDDNNNNQQT